MIKKDDVKALAKNLGLELRTETVDGGFERSRAASYFVTMPNGQVVHAYDARGMYMFLLGFAYLHPMVAEEKWLEEARKHLVVDRL